MCCTPCGIMSCQRCAWVQRSKGVKCMCIIWRGATWSKGKKHAWRRQSSAWRMALQESRFGGCKRRKSWDRRSRRSSRRRRRRSSDSRRSWGPPGRQPTARQNLWQQTYLWMGVDHLVQSGSANKTYFFNCQWMLVFVCFILNLVLHLPCAHFQNIKSQLN